MPIPARPRPMVHVWAPESAQHQAMANGLVALKFLPGVFFCWKVTMPKTQTDQWSQICGGEFCSEMAMP